MSGVFLSPEFLCGFKETRPSRGSGWFLTTPGFLHTLRYCYLDAETDSPWRIALGCFAASSSNLNEPALGDHH